jgi:ribose-phosphate pyrophosphokinase
MFENLTLFALNNSSFLGKKIAQKLGISLGEHEERDFEDGEHKCRPLESVRGKDVYIVQSLYQDAALSVNDKLCRFLFFAGALHDASAARLTAVIPYLCYARKDRKTKPRDPLTTRYVAQLFEAVGINRVVTMDVHNLQAFQNAFRCLTDHLEARKLFVNYFSSATGEDEYMVLSPDAGGIYRAEKFRATLSNTLKQDISLAFVEKHRSQGEVWGGSVVGDVKDKTVIILDDLVNTGGTLVRAAAACKDQGAKKVYACVTHGVFTAKAREALDQPVLDKVIITDTLSLHENMKALIASGKLTVLDTAAFWAEAVQRMDQNGSLVELTED